MTAVLILNARRNALVAELGGLEQCAADLVAREAVDALRVTDRRMALVRWQIGRLSARIGGLLDGETGIGGGAA